MKSGGASQQLAGAFQRQDAAVVGQRMQHDGDVLAGLHHLIEVADAALAHRAGQRAVGPDGVAALQQVAAGEVGGGQVVVAGDGVERPAEPGRHMGDEAGLAAAGRALEQQRQAVAKGLLEQRAFVAGRGVVAETSAAASRHGAALTAMRRGAAAPVRRGRRRSLRSAGRRSSRPDRNSSARDDARTTDRQPRRGASSRTG